jgi:hypothetical protein
MMRALVLGLVLGLLAGCRDQKAVCRRAATAEPELVRHDWVLTCVGERWTDRQIRCRHNWKPGSWEGMSCVEQQ